MTSRLSKQIEKSLKRLGFNCTNTHHKIYSIRINQFVIRTRLSHGVKDYGDDLLARMSKQLYLKKMELIKMIDGEMTLEEYKRILRVKGVI